MARRMPARSDSSSKADSADDRTHIIWLTPFVWEIVVYAFVVLLLVTGTYSRNRIWKNEIELWQDCVMKSPKKDRPHNNLGCAYTREGRYQEAIARFNEALSIKSDLAETHNNLGNALAHEGRYQEAIAQFTETLQINPDYAETHYNLAIAYLKHKMGENSLALREYRILEKVNPELARRLVQKN